MQSNQIEGSGVGSAVVRGVRQLPGPGHLAAPQLVEDLAGLGVTPVVDGRGLPRGEDVERLDRQLRVERNRLERGDDRVAPEERAEPGHAGGHVAVGAAGTLVEEEAQVRHRPGDRQVEQLVIRVDLGGGARPLVVRRDRLVLVEVGGRREEVAGRVARVGLADRGPHRPGQPAALARAERPCPAQPQPGPRVRPVVARPDRLHVRRRLTEPDVRRATAAVEPVVAERDGAGDRSGREQGPARGPALPADLEDVGAVDPELELDIDRLPALGVVDDRQVFLEPAQRQDAFAADPELAPVELVERMDLVLDVAVDARVRELDRAAIVATGRPLEEHRPRPADPQLRARQDARVAVVQPEAAGVDVDVAERVGQEEQVGVLEDLDRPEVRGVGDRDDPRLEPADRRLPVGRLRVIGRGGAHPLSSCHCSR